MAVVQSGVCIGCMGNQTVMRLCSYTVAIAMSCLGCAGESVQEFSDESVTTGGPVLTDGPPGDDTPGWFTERAEATG